MSLTEQINKQYRLAAGSRIVHARKCGDLLIKARAKCNRGEWKPWVAENFEGSYELAATYIRIADNWERLCEMYDNVEYLSIDEALKVLRKAKRSKQAKSASATPRSHQPEQDETPKFQAALEGVGRAINTLSQSIVMHDDQRNWLESDDAFDQMRQQMKAAHFTAGPSDCEFDGDRVTIWFDQTKQGNEPGQQLSALPDSWFGQHVRAKFVFELSSKA